MPSSTDPFIAAFTWFDFWICAGVIAACLMVAITRRGAAEKLFGIVERACAGFAQRKSLAIAALFVAVVAVRLAVLQLLPVPIPGIHDEFSYLLLGDTLAHGRLTNPAHPMWRSFETFHVNWLPTYSSMYPPAQGVVLAIGQLLGNPWIGVLLSDAAMCAAILWMLQGWLPGRWALLGAILAALKLGVASYWMNSYWGGAVAATGGALVLGALPRIRKNGRVRDALLLGAGVAVLANSRPYEGALFCLPVAAWLIWWMAGAGRTKIPLTLRLWRVLSPVVLVLALTGGLMGFYNWRTTGHALVFPYTLNLRTYVSSPIFLWQQAKPPKHYNNRQFEDFYNGWERTDYQRGWTSIGEASLLKWVRLRAVFFWPAAVLLLPACPLIFRDRRVRFLLIVLFVATPGIFAVVWSNPHYAAPLTCVIFALIVQAMRHLRAWKVFARPVGAGLLRAIVLLLAIQTVRDVRARKCDEIAWTCGGDSSRDALLRRLTNVPGKHLILVRYDMDHNIHDEWVFNGAEIDGAKVLWARELDAAQNAALVNYFSDRTVWLVNPDENNLELIPYRRRDAGSAP
ncbi:MAG TPA: hypothetical protein VKF79_01005 [Candidatus Acidoferrum sp.]|nr:hypothetical protein [Candidatus Acidoferrum sp.]